MSQTQTTATSAFPFWLVDVPWKSCTSVVGDTEEEALTKAEQMRADEVKRLESLLSAVRAAVLEAEVIRAPADV